MNKGPAPIAWDIVDLALVGAMPGMLVGVLFCRCQMLTSPTHDPHRARDSAIDGVVSALLYGALPMIRLWIMETTNSQWVDFDKLGKSDDHVL